MSNERRRILDLLAQGKITADEAEQLLAAIDSRGAAGASEQTPPGSPERRYVRINIHKAAHAAGDRERDVNIRVPFSVVRSGIRLGAIIPGFGDRIAAKARERGIDLDMAKMDEAQLDAMLRNLNDMTIDVDGGQKQVRISYE